MVIIKLFSCDLKIILLFYIYSSTKSILLTGNITRAVLVKPSMFALSEFYNSAPSYGTVASPNGRSGE
jgi:hypothetical protein